MHRRLPNDHSLIADHLAWLRARFVAEGVLDEARCLRFSGAIDEALQNAHLHGNLEVDSVLKDRGAREFEDLVDLRRQQAPYRDRGIDVTVEWDDVEVRVTVGDEGPGFDVGALADPTDPENRDRGHGRGVLMMRAFADDVRFNDRGNEVTLVKRRTP